MTHLPATACVDMAEVVSDVDVVMSEVGDILLVVLVGAVKGTSIQSILHTAYLGFEKGMSL